MFARGGSRREMRQIAELALVDAELESITLFKLMKAFENVMEQFNDKKVVAHTIARYDYTIQEQQNYLFTNLLVGVKTSFEEVFRQLENRIHAIVTFLAMLELVSQQRIELVQGEGPNNFWLTIPEDLPEDADVSHDDYEEE